MRSLASHSVRWPLIIIINCAVRRPHSDSTPALIHSLGTPAGNPAAVCLLTTDIADELKQLIAAEMNLSETAFVIPRERYVI